jgi:hypothetical protein
MRSLAAGLPAGVQVWIGGRSSSLLPQHSLPERFSLVGGRPELERRLDLLLAA